VLQICNKMKKKNRKIPHCQNISKIQLKNHRNKGKMYAPKIHIHDHSLSCPGTVKTCQSSFKDLCTPNLHIDYFGLLEIMLKFWTLQKKGGLLLDWLMFNANFSSISTISWCEQILYYFKTPTRPLEIKHTCL
jgi:hypothetical protein